MNHKMVRPFIVKVRLLSPTLKNEFFGHISIHESLFKMILQGTVEVSRHRCHPNRN